MKYRRLGRTDLKISIISLGGVELGYSCSYQKVKEIMNHLSLRGINFVDVSEVYGDAEKKLGQAFSENNKKIHIFSKTTKTSEKEVNFSIKQSLKKLKLDCIDIYGIHGVNNEDDLRFRLNQGCLKALKKAKNDGLIRFIGITGHHIPTLMKAIKSNDFDVVMVHYNIGNTLAEPLIEMAYELDVGSLAMKPLGGATFIDPKFCGENPHGIVKKLTAKNALTFILSNKKLSSAVVGMRDIWQIDENSKIIDSFKPLPINKRKILRNNVRKLLGDQFCRRCRYCEPCAKNGQNLEIAEILRLLIFYKKFGYKKNAREIYSRLRLKANVCKGCGECEKKCPFNLPIIKLLKEAHATLNQ